jgi:hypothetical protein
MDQRNLFFEREAGQQIFDARPDWLGAVQIKRAFLRAGVPGACRHDRGGNQRHGAMLDFGHKTHNFLLVQIFVKSIRSRPPRPPNAISPALSPVR